MARRSSHHPHGSPRYLFSEVEDPSVLSGQFWAQLFRYRPLVLLGVFWLTLICISAVAYSRLMFSGVPVSSSAGASMVQQSSPPPVIRPAPRGVGNAETSLSAMNQADAPRPVSKEALTNETEEHSLSKGQGQGVPWKTLAELGLLVGLCALGSFVITWQAKRPPRPKTKKKKRKVVSKVVRKPKSFPRTITPPKRLAPFAPERDSVVVPEAITASRSTVTNPLPSFSKTPDLSNTHHPSGSQHQPEAPQPAETHNPDIVPDHEDHPLDWSEESIAHSLDLRHRRSLSSFM
jgi:hypothetical protein